MYYLNQTQSNRIFWQTSLFVISIHAVLIFWMVLTPSSFKEPIPKKQKLVVKTVDLIPRIETVDAPSLIAFQPEPKYTESIQESIPEPESELIEKEIETIEEEPVRELKKPTPEIEKPKESIKKIEPPKKTEPKPTPKKTEVVKPREPVKKVEPPKKQEPKPAPKKTEIVKKIEPVKKTAEKKAEPVKQVVKEKVTKKELEKPKIDQAAIAARQKAEKEALEKQEKQKKLLAAAQQSMAMIDKGRAQLTEAKTSMSKVSVTAPVAGISKLEIEDLPNLSGPALTSGERHYRDELASRLKLSLKLPEHGAVQVKLTLNRAGKALKVQIVKSASQANKNHIEKTLPTMVFPPFGSHFESLSEYTFSIQLSNEL